MQKRIDVAVACVRDIVAARQQGRELAQATGFSATDATLIATAISELARNIVLYARRGTISIEARSDSAQSGIVVTARDEGPGIREVERALAGGYTTSGGMGLGLCGVRRIMDEMDVASKPGEGTTVTIRKWLHP